MTLTQAPPPARTRPRAASAKRLRPRAYSVAVYLVGAIILLQASMLLSVFWLRARVVPVNTAVPRPVATLAGHAPASRPLAVVAPPVISEAQRLSLPGLALGGPGLSLLSLPSPTDKFEQIGSWNEQARARLRQNDYRGSIELLTKAEDLDPRNPTTLKNLAEARYAANDAVLSKIYWQRLVDLGPGVGSVYALAKDHLLLLSTVHDADPLRQESPLKLSRTVFIEHVEKTPVETVSGQSQFRVRTVLARKDPKAVFEQKKLRPFVIFYQQMKDGTLAPDLAPHAGGFDNTFLFWSGKKTEPFSIEYVLPIPGLPTEKKTIPGEYYGFVIGIYYENILTDARSEPTSLLARQPLPDAIE